MCDQIKACLADCVSVLREQGDGTGAERFAKASTMIYFTTEKRQRLKGVEAFSRK